jgi:hypothetical protein
LNPVYADTAEFEKNGQAKIVGDVQRKRRAKKNRDVGRSVATAPENAPADRRHPIALRAKRSSRMIVRS